MQPKHKGYILSSNVVCALFMNACSFLFFLLLEGLKEETKQLLSSSSKKKGKGGAKNESSKSEETKPDSQPVTIHLNFKRYIYDPHKKMVQSWPSFQSFLINADRRGTGITNTEYILLKSRTWIRNVLYVLLCAEFQFCYFAFVCRNME